MKTIAAILVFGFGALVFGQGGASVFAREGDTVKVLAQRHGLDAVELAKINGLLPDTTLKARQELKMPSGRCEMNVADAPAIKTLRLGMDENKAAEIVGDRFSQDSTDKYTRDLRSLTHKAVPFNDVDFVALKSFEDKLYEIRVNYDITWANATEFVDNFAPKLGVARRYWTVDITGLEAKVDCGDFTIRLASLGKTSFLVLTDEAAKRRIASMKTSYEEDKKKAIKP
jgi:hypothetical protein